MRIKHVLWASGIAIGLSVGVAAGLSSFKASHYVEAAGGTETTGTIYVAVSTATVNSASYTSFNVRVNCNVGDNNTWVQTTAAKTPEDSFAGLTVFKGTYTERWGGVDGMQIQLYDGNTWIGQRVPISSYTGTSEFAGKLYFYDGDGGSHASGSWSTYTPSFHTVTQYAVINNESPSVMGTVYIKNGETYGVPDTIVGSGYHFVNWYSDAECTDEYEATVANNDFSIYAKLLSFSQDRYIYYVTGSESPTGNMIHTWGGDNEYAEKDVYIAGISGIQEIHGVLHFDGTAQLIYRIPFSSESGDDKFRFHWNNGSTKSDDFDLISGSAFKWGPEVGYDPEAAGDAIDFLLAAEEKRNAVKAGTFQEFSICGVSPADAGVLCTTYNGLSEKARGYVDDSTALTYKRDKTGGNEDVRYYYIMEELARIAGGVSLTGHAAAIVAPSLLQTESNATPISIAAISAVSVISVGGFFFIRKRKGVL